MQLRHTWFRARIAACLLACIEAGRVVACVPAGIGAGRVVACGARTLTACSITCPSLAAVAGNWAGAVACGKRAGGVGARPFAGIGALTCHFICTAIWQACTTPCET
jgi:hypothetical protein